ncbi:EFR1 family ferrodoxin [Bacteroides eggerthii]|jgi:ferredoxin|uniref:EFR1 family ferrodoxin n=1 Tax=Bacteroides eggerthii TaxID=28111 RepID=A0ABT7U5C4_9BACE|nr:EFR1 family ferrodoxin [Bacteroides eggerthii]
MIFYFSGTGNSLYAARHLAKATQDRLISIPEEMSDPAFSKEYALSTDERIGFVFPIHSWGPPEIVLRFIRRIRFANYQNHYCFFVATCGDDMGCTQQILKQALSGIHINLHAGFSLIMPNTYIALPGFDVDSPEVQKRKLEDAVPELERMESDVCRKTNTFRLHPGGMPRLKSYLILPLFRKFLINDKYFQTTDQCIACGKCAQICPTNNIRIENKRPVWQGHCTACLACYHVCPQRAVYFFAKKNKGQYLHPDLLKYGKEHH